MNASTQNGAYHEREANGNLWRVALFKNFCCGLTIGTGTQTCNGNGDGKIGGPSVGAGLYYAAFRFWQHLANAGFVAGSFTGVTDSLGALDGTAGVNVPQGRMGTISYLPNSEGIQNGNSWYWDGNWDNMMYVTGSPSSSAYGQAMLTGEEVFLLDQKMNDGSPATGSIRTYKDVPDAGWDDCVTSADPLTVQYVTDTSEKDCEVLFLPGW